MRKLRIVSMCLALFPMAGCASIVDGQNQSLSVKTTNAGGDLAGAQCGLTNTKGTWFVNAPGTVTVHRAYSALSVKCQKEGFVPAIVTVQSTTKGMAYGNLLFGGVIGAGVDMSTGAAYDYPPLISVPMTEVGAMPPPTSAATPTPPAS